MDVVSLCPFRVTSVLWQQRPGSWIKTVICKGTFEIVPGEARLAPDQEEPNEQDNHWDDDPARSLYSPSDIVPFKTRCDVLLVGHAFAPGGEPVRSLVARMRIGEINKAIEVFGERLWTLDKGVREGARFSKMPLRYERASGGPMSWNPVGVRTDLRPNASTLVPIPNLQPAGTRLTEPGVFTEPVGFGPIAPSWPPRRHRLGPYAGTFTDQSLRREPLPPDMDPGFWNSAPRDQQPGNIRSNERIALENLHPEHARLTTALPGLYPRAFVDKGAGSAPQELPLTCDTLWIDTDRALCTLTWRACLPVEGPAQVGRILIGMEGPGKRLAWADIERLAALAPATASQGHAPQAAIEIVDPETIDGEPIEDDEEDEARATQLPPSARRRPAAGAPAAPPEGGDEVLETLAFPVNFQKLAALQGEKRGPMDTVLADFDQEEAWPSDAVLPPGAAPPLANPAMPFVKAPRGAPGAPAPSRPAVAKGPGAPPAPGPPPPAPEGPRIRFGPPPPPSPSSPGDAAPAWLSQPRVSPPVAPPPPPPGAGNPHTSAIPLASVGAPSGAGTPVPPSPVSAPPITPMPGHSPTLPSKPIEFGPPPSPAVPSLLAVPVPSAVVAQPLLTPAPQPSSPPIAPISSPPVAPAGEGIAHPGVGTAALAGALAASNAAAAAARVEPAPAASPAAPLPRHFGSNAPREACHLLWYEKESVSAVRAAPDWKALIESLDKDREPAFFDFDEEPPPEPPPEVQERRAIVAVLTRAPAMDTDTLGLLLIESVGDDGSFTPPLVVMAGELFFPFDEVETLKATVTAVTPLIAPDRDKKLKETVDTANELLKTPWIHSSSGIAEGMTQKVREAFAQGSRMMPAGYLDTHTQRILLEQRHYQKRSVFGEEAIRSELMPFGSQVPIPTYLPSGLAKKLPMFQRLKVRLIGEAHVQQDQFESHPSALRVVALGRAVTLGGRGR
jgi:hypothetical protein